MFVMQEIVNYYQITDKIATSGQPTREQFQKIADAGYESVINLALPSSKNALADEGTIVAGLGMAYFHIPVVWEAPKLDDVRLFFDVMKSLSDRKVWVHCALNMNESLLFSVSFSKARLKVARSAIALSDGRNLAARRRVAVAHSRGRENIWSR
ncbi:protein tyrosine phosphatase family protein [Hydrococcus rivularis]|uniref:protein tyrosine phosphatase family protein n=1 Tax=Hydrococcus rivularis TaxID=1616834 RepID=UPI000AD0ABE6|nr:protein tyrosine phosphatase family protein [Hydrococcus rivularis]